MKSVHIIALAAILLFVGCASDPRLDMDTVYLGGRRVSPRPGTDGTATQRRMNFDNVSYWDGGSVAGAPRIRINRGDQKAYFYKGDQLVGVSMISTGREGYDSPSGRFAIVQKDRDHISSIYGDYVDAATGEVVMKDIDRRKDKMPRGAKYDGARMPYFMRFVGGVGMHEGFLPGYPASHGCIRMPGFMAAAFFNNVNVGTPVIVEQMKPEVPEIGVREVQAALASPTPPRLIDVREPDEWEHSRIPGAELLPLSQWPQLAIEKLTDKNQSLLIHCHHGGRSARATAWLLSQGFANVKNVAGGIDAWSTEIDSSVPRYD